MKKIALISSALMLFLISRVCIAGRIEIKNLPDEWDVLEEKRVEIDYEEYPNIYINPTFREFKLNPGEFSRFIIKVISDSPTKITLRKRLNSKYIKLKTKPNVLIKAKNSVKWVEIFVSLPKSGEKFTEIIDIMSNTNSEVLQSCKIVVVNKQAIYQSTSIRASKNIRNSNDNYTITHSFRCDKGSWAWRASTSLSKNRISGSFSINW